MNYLSAGKTQEITAEDKQASGELKIKKRIALDDVVLAHGEPTFIFEINGTSSVDGQTYRASKSVTFSEEYISSLIQNGNVQYAEMTALFTDIPTGTCTVSETEVQRYELSRISDVSQNGATGQNNTVTFNITNEALQCSATFTNVKTVQSKASHTAAEINMLKKARRITSMSAVWTGKPYYTETVLDRSLLDVFIVFDDGTTEKLGDNEYELWNGDQQLSQPDTDDFETDTIADVTIDVRFTNAGRTYSDSFDLTIMMEMPVTMFTYSVTDGPFTDGEAYYDGTAVITGYLGDSTNISIPKTVIGERKLTDPYSGEYEDHYSAKQYKVIGIESIEEYEPAYGFAYAETVVLPSTVSMIGDYAFCNNSSLNDIDLSNITDIGKQAFYYNTGLTEADLSNAVNIGDSAFYGCTGIEEADLVNIRTIGDEAFYDCSEISVINIGDDVYSVGENAFVGTAVYDAADNGVYYLGEGRVLAGHKGYSSNVPSEFTVADGTLCIADSALPSCGIEELNLPDTLKYIGKNAFAENNIYELNIPDSVLEIRDRAFYDCVSLEEIIIPDSVVLIGDYSFYCGYNAERIFIGNGVRTIGDYAFFDHYDVSELTLGSSIETIGEGAFGYLGSIKEAVIPDSVVTIGDRAFTDCGSLENLVIGNGVTYIGEEAFTWCGNSSSEDYGDEHTHMEVTFGTGLKTIADSAFYYSGITGPPSGDPSKGNALILPEGLESIGRYAFSECPHLGYVYLPDSITFMDESAFSGYSKASCTNGMWTDNIPAGLSEISPWVFYGSAMGPDVVFPDTLTRIGERAFSENSAIETFTFSDSLTAIDDDAFYQCVNLDGTVNITKGITEIGKNPFAYCTSLDAFSVDAQNESFTAVDGILYTKDVTELVAYPAGRSLDGYVMPDTVTKIRPGAFDGCTGGSFTLSQNLLEIPAYAFFHSSISEITIPDTVIKIGEYAFSYCSNLQSIVVPDSVTTMGSGVFYYSTSLQSAVIGSGMTEIPSSTFNNCTSLRDVTLSGSVTTISASAFAKCTSLEEIELPSQLTSFGNNAFDGCTSLQSIDIPDGVTALSNYLFNNCSSLASVEYPDELVSVGSYTFSGCTSLSSAALPASVKTIGTYAFNNCSGLRQVSYPLGTLTSLGTYAFKGCSSLTEIIIPYSINAVPAGLCYGCTGLTSIKYALRSEYEPGYDPDTTPDTNVRQINSSAFTNCSSMTVFSVPDSVRVIDQSAFSGWTKLRVLTFSESMTKIGSNAFSGCTSLEEVTIGGPVSESNAMKNIFGNNNSIKKVVIIDGVTTLGSYAFRGCTELEDITIPNTVMYTSKYSKKVNNYTYYYTDAFAGLTKIKHVTIGETINYDYNNTIGGTSYYSISNMFSDSRTSITSITVLDGVTRLMGSFGGCPNLTSFTIPDSVTYLTSSFSGDTSLTDITIPDSVACITTNFSGTPIYTSVYNAASAGDLIYILNGKILCGYKGSPRPSGEIVVPEGTEYILPSAFNNCTDLSSLSLPSTIKCLGGSAFSDCYLRDITFKTMKNIRYMGSLVFDYSPFTYNHNVEGKVYADSSGVIYIKAQDGSKILYATDSRGRGTMTVEDDTYVIAGGVHSYILRWSSSGSSFTGITIPSTVKSIGPSAFNKSSLTSLCSRYRQVYLGRSLLQQYEPEEHHLRKRHFRNRSERLQRLQEHLAYKHNYPEQRLLSRKKRL